MSLLINKNPSLLLGPESAGLEQFALAGVAFTGVLPADDALVHNRDRGVHSFAEQAADGGGLFDLDILPGRRNPFLTQIHVIADSTVTWDLYATSGLRDGSAATLDAPALDAEVASGTGSALVRLRLELLPQMCLRFTSAAAGANGLRVILHLAGTLTEGGRII